MNSSINHENYAVMNFIVKKIYMTAVNITLPISHWSGKSFFRFTAALSSNQTSVKRYLNLYHIIKYS